MSTKDISSNDTHHRTDYINWEDYFMATALLTAKRSKDPTCQVGACIVNEEKKIVGVGYNGFPTGCDDDVFPWSKNTSNPLDSKFVYVCHAERNAILNANSSTLKNCIIYVGLFPCNECAKAVIQSGIKEVVYMSDKHWHKKHTKAAKKLFDSSGVKYRQYEPKERKITIDFAEFI